VVDGKAAYRDRVDARTEARIDLDRGAVRAELMDVHVEAPPDVRGTGEERLHRAREPLREPRGAHQVQRPLPAPELAVQDEKRQAAEMVAVEMRYGDDGHIAGFEPESVEPGEGGRAAVDEHRARSLAPRHRLHMQAGLEPAAGAERIAGPRHRHSNDRLH
jgi:hypothetical protein